MSGVREWRLLALFYPALLIACSVIAYFIGSTAKRSTGFLDGPVTVDPESLHFPETWDNEAFRWDLVFKNMSDISMVVRDVQTSCSCARIDGADAFRLTPGGQASLKLIINLQEIGRYHPSQTRPVAVGISANVGHESGPLYQHRWTLSGSVRRILSCEPLQIALGEQLVSGEFGSALEFCLTPKRSVVQLRLKRTPEGWHAELIQKPSELGNYVLRAIPFKLKPGLFVDEFEIEPIAPDGQALATQFVKVEGRVTDSIQILPNPVDLGRHVVGTHARATLVITARNNQPFELLEVVPDDPVIKVLDFRHKEHLWYVDLERPIDGPGAHVDSGLVIVSCRSSPRKELKFELCWYGLTD